MTRHVIRCSISSRKFTSHIIICSSVSSLTDKSRRNKAGTFARIRRMNRITIILLIILISGCTTQNAAEKESFIQSMNKWVGRSADDLVAANGAPSNVYQQGSGGRVFEYIRLLILSETEAERLRHYLAMHQNQPTKFLYVPDTRPPSATSPTRLGQNVLGAGKTCKLLFDISAGNIVESWSIGEGTCY